MAHTNSFTSSVRSAYHFATALVSAARYGFPSRAIRVIGVTGTKGKTSTTEMVAAIFEAAGQRTALSNSIREKIGDTSRKNPTGRSMPGRGHLQNFLREAVDSGCETAVIEMTSEGARQHRTRHMPMQNLRSGSLSPARRSARA
jgi:UDP-N-acetylmuramoyl-L-alanyl-D-glutamate--2,6-diaminopimelate ligase